MVIFDGCRFPLGFGLSLIGGRLRKGMVLWGVGVEVDTVGLEVMSALADDIENRNIRLNNKNVDLVFFHAGVNLLLLVGFFDW